VALLTLKGRNEDKVKFSAEHLKRELEKTIGNVAADVSPRRSISNQSAPTDVGGYDANTPTIKPPAFKDLIIAGPAPAPLLRAETFYRYQIMLRTRAMSKLARHWRKSSKRSPYPKM